MGSLRRFTNSIDVGLFICLSVIKNGHNVRRTALASIWTRIELEVSLTTGYISCISKRICNCVCTSLNVLNIWTNCIRRATTRHITTSKLELNIVYNFFDTDLVCCSFWIIVSLWNIGYDISFTTSACILRNSFFPWKVLTIITEMIPFKYLLSALIYTISESNKCESTGIFIANLSIPTFNNVLCISRHFWVLFVFVKNNYKKISIIN